MKINKDEEKEFEGIRQKMIAKNSFGGITFYIFSSLICFYLIVYFGFFALNRSGSLFLALFVWIVAIVFIIIVIRYMPESRDIKISFSNEVNNELN